MRTPARHASTAPASSPVALAVALRAAGRHSSLIVRHRLGRIAVLIGVLLGPASPLSAQVYTFTRLAGPNGGPAAADGTGPAARFDQPSGVAVGADGTIYIADTNNHIIRKLTAGGVVTTLAGLARTPGAADGTTSEARFNSPTGLAVDAGGTLYVADTGNHTIRKVTRNGVVTTLAGLAGYSDHADGTGSAARFDTPRSVSVDASGITYVADARNNAIRKVSIAGAVTTLAGGALGAADGTGAAAQFNGPSGVAVDVSGMVYVADTDNHTIRVITPGGVVTTLAGTPGQTGDYDGTGGAALFSAPAGITVGSGGLLYVAETNNHAVRSVTTVGVVSLLAGATGSPGARDANGAGANFWSPVGIATAPDGDLYIADRDNHVVRMVTPTGDVTTPVGVLNAWGYTDDSGTAARFFYPGGIAADTGGTVFVADTTNHVIRKITPGGIVTTFAGDGFRGTADGTGAAARFDLPQGIALDTGGNLYVADTFNQIIRKITPAGVVTTLAGLADTSGDTNGTGNAARFRSPRAVAVDASGNVYVADSGNHTIRKITPAGVVTTLAGFARTSGLVDATGSAARFNGPQGIAVTPGGIVFVADTGNHVIRRVTPAGVVTTVAGSTAGTADGVGTAAQFNSPKGLTTDGAGTGYVADFGSHTIRRITLSGQVSTIGGLPGTPGSADGSGSAARFNYPLAVGANPQGEVFVADSYNHAVRRGVSGATSVTLTVVAAGAGAGAIVSVPAGIACGVDCAEAYDQGAAVTLTATANAGSTFEGWSGGGCSGIGMCLTSVTAASTVTATFGLVPVPPTYTRYLAEGATSSFLDTRIALLNPGAIDTTATISFLVAGAAPVVTQVPVPAGRRVTVDPKMIPGLAAAEFATKIEALQPLVVDRTVSWDVASGYGAHAETSIAEPALTWYLAEGATHSGFNLFYLLQNPTTSEAQVRVRYLLPSGSPLEKTYALAPNSRTNIWVNEETFPSVGKALAATDVSAAFDSVNGTPFIVERALYLDRPGQTFAAGHESAGVVAPAPQWFLAEGATGDYFDLFVLIANPNGTEVEVEATYLLPDGTTIVKPYVVPANSRFNIWVDGEDPHLADTAVSTTVRAVQGDPIIVERALWWPGGFEQWYEAHNSPGARATGVRWALAEGEVGGPRDSETYILLANTSTSAASVRVRVLYEDGTSGERTFAVNPNSRFNVDVRTEFPSAVGQRFGALVESLGALPAQIVVERAMYWNAGGVFWAAGTNALATRLK